MGRRRDDTDLPPILDVEFPGDGRAETGLTVAECVNGIRAAHQELKQHYGFDPIV